VSSNDGTKSAEGAPDVENANQKAQNKERAETTGERSKQAASNNAVASP